MTRTKINLRVTWVIIIIMSKKKTTKKKTKTKNIKKWLLFGHKKQISNLPNKKAPDASNHSNQEKTIRLKFRSRFKFRISHTGDKDKDKCKGHTECYQDNVEKKEDLTCLSKNVRIILTIKKKKKKKKHTDTKKIPTAAQVTRAKVS